MIYWAVPLACPRRVFPSTNFIGLEVIGKFSTPAHFIPEELDTLVGLILELLPTTLSEPPHCATVSRTASVK